MKTILFDIDKTLVKSYKRNGNIWSDLFTEIYGCRKGIGISKITSHGKAMKQIVFEALSNQGLELDEIERKWPEFRKRLVEDYEIVLESVDPFDDAIFVLEELQNRGFRLGVITGNLKDIAFLKLKLAGLDSYFSFGGFGDNMNRDDIAKDAVEDRDGGEVILVGDTPLDIVAGKSINARTIGISTGIYSKKDLQDVGADFVVGSLTELLEVLK